MTPDQFRPRPPFAFALALAASALVAAPSSAQVRFEGTPAASWSRALPADLPVAAIPRPDVERLRAEDLAPEVGPLRYGEPVPTWLDMNEAGRWDMTEEGGFVWRMRVAAPGAYSIGLEFAHYSMPPGAKLFLYDPSMQTVFGAYDWRNESPDGEFVTEPFPGDQVILEYHQPPGISEEPRIVVDRVIWDYRDVFELMRGLDTYGDDGGGAGGCALVDVNCPDGDPFENEKSATLRTFSGGGLCSGVLVNNTAVDGTRYVLTANHCGQSNNTVFTFNYQRSGCGSGSAPSNQTVSGATVLATHCDSDHRLMRINSNIPSSYNAYYAGWSRSTTNPNFAVSMHHPGGGPKKISIDNNGGGKSFGGFIGIPCTVSIWALDFHVGSTQGGSSGGPMFDQNDRVRGVLTGGPSDCSVSYYGRFYNFWNTGNVAQYLDPGGTNLTNLDGFDPSCGQPVNYGFNKVSTTGNSPVIGSTGTPSVSGGGFTVTLTGGKPSQFCVLIDGTTQTALPQNWGFLWVGGAVQRHYMNTDANGAASFNVPLAGLAGTTRYYEWIIRDTQIAFGAHHSGGLQVTFCQ